MIPYRRGVVNNPRSRGHHDGGQTSSKDGVERQGKRTGEPGGDGHSSQLYHGSPGTYNPMPTPLVDERSSRTPETATQG